MKKLSLFILLLFFTCSGQIKKYLPLDSVIVCWNKPEGEVDSFSYFLYYREYTDTTWLDLGSTDSLYLKILRLGKGNYVLGVKVFFNGIYSDMHSSIDTNACIRSDENNVCIEYGAWYITWYLGKPTRIRIK